MNVFKTGLTLILLILFSGCGGDARKADADKIRTYANALYQRRLYQHAADVYQHYLDSYKTDENTKANIHFTIANIYFERINDYENALSHYLKIKHVYDKSSLIPQVDKRIIECLERLQRSADARQALKEATHLDWDSSRESRPGDVVAKIGEREITTGDLNFRISQLPDYLQQQFEDPQARLEFLKQYISTELLYDAALRMGLDKDKEIIEGAFQAQKQLMVQKYLEQEIAEQMGQITREDAELYFKAHKERYAEKDEDGNIVKEISFRDAAQQAAQDLAMERQQKAYEELMRRIFQTEQVRIFSDRIQ